MLMFFIFVCGTEMLVITALEEVVWVWTTTENLY